MNELTKQVIGDKIDSITKKIDKLHLLIAEHDSFSNNNIAGVIKDFENDNPGLKVNVLKSRTVNVLQIKKEEN